ncbi:MAG: anion permease [Spirochaetales bacterium]|nr:anion permease [Spirochaetales bacterium]
MWKLISGVFMGWALGSNDSANIFGTAVASKTIKYRTAVILCASFVIVGALLEGQAGLKTLSGLTTQTLNTAFISSLAAALTVTLMTILKLPVSTSQAAVGAIIGIGILHGDLNLSGLTKVALVWVGTPTGALVLSLILYPVLAKLLDIIPMNIFTRDYVIKGSLLIAGSYGAYALGANNVANVTGVYAKVGLLTLFGATLVGGVSIALGVVTFSKRVMMTVGKSLVKLDPFSALIAILAHSIVLHIFALVGVPTSSSQAIIGAVLGIGILKGIQTINLKTLLLILFGWVGTPLIAVLISIGLASLYFL